MYPHKLVHYAPEHTGVPTAMALALITGIIAAVMILVAIIVLSTI
jgi:hypothetical protein